MADATTSTQLTTPFPRASAAESILNAILILSFCVLFLSVFSSAMAAVEAPQQHHYHVYYDPKSKQYYKVKPNCGKKMLKHGYHPHPHMEHFGNANLFEKKQQPFDPYVKATSNVYTHKDFSETSFQRVSLFAPDSKHGLFPQSMYHGEAQRWIMQRNEHLVYQLEFFCNLPELNGDILVKRKRDVPQKYTAYLSKDAEGEEILELGDLQRDGDYVYKLKITSDDVAELAAYKFLHVVYHFGDEDHIVLQGEFKSNY